MLFCYVLCILVYGHDFYIIKSWYIFGPIYYRDSSTTFLNYFRLRNSIAKLPLPMLSKSVTFVSCNNHVFSYFVVITWPCMALHIFEWTKIIKQSWWCKMRPKMYSLIYLSESTWSFTLQPPILLKCGVLFLLIFFYYYCNFHYIQIQSKITKRYENVSNFSVFSHTWNLQGTHLSDTICWQTPVIHPWELWGQICLSVRLAVHKEDNCLDNSFAVIVRYDLMIQLPSQRDEVWNRP